MIQVRLPMRFARFELSLKKTRKNQEKKKQIKIEMRFEFFMFHLRKMRDTNQATKIKKNLHIDTAHVIEHMRRYAMHRVVRVVAYTAQA